MRDAPHKQTGGGSQRTETTVNTTSAETTADEANTTEETTEDITENDSALSDEEIDALMQEGRDYYYAENGKERDLDRALEIFENVAEESDDAQAWYYIGRIKEFRSEYADAIDAYEIAVDMNYDLARE